ncbi:MAG: hypothetical protein JWM02_993 [Frankiales bacterium]|nr:hypothetical protein [Frankiales bacterium]
MNNYLRRCTAGCLALGLLGLMLGWTIPAD